jgi:hypothetical protein
MLNRDAKLNQVFKALENDFSPADREAILQRRGDEKDFGMRDLERIIGDNTNGTLALSNGQNMAQLAADLEKITGKSLSELQKYLNFIIIGILLVCTVFMSGNYLFKPEIPQYGDLLLRVEPDSTSNKPYNSKTENKPSLATSALKYVADTMIDHRLILFDACLYSQSRLNPSSKIIFRNCLNSDLSSHLNMLNSKDSNIILIHFAAYGRWDSIVNLQYNRLWDLSHLSTSKEINVLTKETCCFTPSHRIENIEVWKACHDKNCKTILFDNYSCPRPVLHKDQTGGFHLPVPLRSN